MDPEPGNQLGRPLRSPSFLPHPPTEGDHLSKRERSTDHLERNGHAGLAHRAVPRHLAQAQMPLGCRRSRSHGNASGEGMRFFSVDEGIPWHPGSFFGAERFPERGAPS